MSNKKLHGNLTLEKLRGFIAEGYTPLQICGLFDVSSQTLYAFIRKNGWPLPSEIKREQNPLKPVAFGNSTGKLARLTEAEYRARVLRGQSHDEIAKDFGVTRIAIYTHARRHGWPPPRAIRQQAGIKNHHPGRARDDAVEQRNQEMLELRLANRSYAEIGKLYGLTEEGARMAIVKHSARKLEELNRAIDVATSFLRK